MSQGLFHPCHVLGTIALHIRRPAEIPLHDRNDGTADDHPAGSRSGAGPCMIRRGYPESQRERKIGKPADAVHEIGCPGIHALPDARDAQH